MSARKDSPPTPAASSNLKSRTSNRASGEDEEQEEEEEQQQQQQQQQQRQQRQARFPPEEEATLVAESNAHKSEANALFASSKYNAALGKYDEAVAACPTYLDYELAVLRSNIAACHLKLEGWKEAIGNATVALDGLDRLEREEAEREAVEKEEAKKYHGAPQDNDDEDDGVEEEVVSAGASKAASVAPAPTREKGAAAQARQKRRDDIARIRAKALMRRARARSELGGWSNLEGALTDYRALAAATATATTALGAADRRIVQAQLVSLPARAKAAQEAETAEMWGKLKELGNGILKPFGLSTDHFQMVKDEKTGGYSMSFGGGPGDSGGGA